METIFYRGIHVKSNKGQMKGRSVRKNTALLLGPVDSSNNLTDAAESHRV